MFMHMHTSMSVFICTVVGQVRSENVSSCVACYFGDTDLEYALSCTAIALIVVIYHL